MIELIIEKNNINESIYIRKLNGIVSINKMKLLNFYNNFDLCLIEKNEDIKIYIDNKRVVSKDYILINIMDISSIIDSLKFKKGSLLYEYISNFYNNDDLEEISNIELFIEELFLKHNEDLKVKCNYEFNVDIWKLLTCTIDIFPIIDMNELSKILNEIINIIIKIKFDKSYIIFYDSSIISIDIKNYDNCYVFDISNKLKYDEYNILLKEEICNIDTNMLKDKLQLNWPLPIKDIKICKLLNNYYIDYFNKDNIITYDECYIYLIKLLNKYYNLDKKILTNFENLSDITKSFLDKY